MSEIQSKTEIVEPGWVGEVIHFWFKVLSEKQWFAKNDVVDAQIRDRFLPLHQSLVAHDGLDAPTPRWTLAMVVVLDQFSRNMFRGDPRAFAGDAIARRISRSAIERGFDIGMTAKERMFLYLPFEHSEDASDQSFALDLIRSLGDESWTRYATAHKTIIERFGRFPHRNVVLDRQSSAEEVEFLKDPSRSF